MCAGTPLPGITMKIIKITDDPIAEWNEHLAVPQGEIGEIAVKGPVVTRSYLNRPEQTAGAKIREGDEGMAPHGGSGVFRRTGAPVGLRAKVSPGTNCRWHALPRDVRDDLQPAPQSAPNCAGRRGSGR